MVSWHLITRADCMKLISSLPIILVDLMNEDNIPHTIPLDLRMGRLFLTILVDFQTAISLPCITDHTHSDLITSECHLFIQEEQGSLMIYLLSCPLEDQCALQTLAHLVQIHGDQGMVP